MSSVINGIKQLVIPPGGWKYEQPVENAAPMLIDAQTYPMLVDRALSFRLNNVEIIPSGTATRESVEEDIRAFICGRYPQQCTGPAPLPKAAETKEETAAYLPPIRRVEDWFKRLNTSPLTWRSPVQAVANAEICANCPQNVSWEVHCQPCVDAVTRRILRYKGDRITPVENRLKACRIYGHHNALACWLENTFSDPKEQPPDPCWNRVK